jgi:threonine synthase
VSELIPRQRFINSYIDTRGNTVASLPFSAVILKGLADGGGLYVPVTLPRLSIDEIISMAGHSYAEQAAFIYKCFGVDFEDSQIDEMMHAAYGDNFTQPEVAPVIEVTPNTWVLELVHGPTSAFKDMALQCLPYFFSAALEKTVGSGSSVPHTADADVPLHLILVATSGDTGSAAQQGFKNRQHTGIIVYFPENGVSDIQKRQMTTVEGDNVGAFGVYGSFDDCQNAVKSIFNDDAFNAVLADRNVRLSSANSINWGRLLPQVVYFVSTYARLVANKTLAPGQLLDVCVPTGNFGHILAAWYAREIGTPIGHLYCASNENHVLSDFINTGIYDISDRPFIVTPSPSMDILISSNLERLLFELTGRNFDLINSWMNDLSTRQVFHVDKPTFAALRRVFAADWVSSADSLEAIRRVHAESGYLADPHTAVAWEVASRLRLSTDTPLLVTATAHWAKFAADVYRALQGVSPDEALPDDVVSLSGSELITLIQKQYSSAEVPARLISLDDLPVRFSATSDPTPDSIRQTVLDWLDARDY